MPKQPTFEKIYPTLRKPLGLQKKSKFTVTLREKNNLSFLSTNVTSNMDFIINSTITPDSNFINNYEKAVPKHISLSNIHVMDHNNINNSYIQDNLIRNTEDIFQIMMMNIQILIPMSILQLVIEIIMIWIPNSQNIQEIVVLTFQVLQLCGYSYGLLKQYRYSCLS
ncbi:hypothetical protein RCL_jg29211.t1 [Rhizophagus clarus]|uniref:Uncharacterized protein n=1 Tax=Rhizophagus clarus TaxID=94130 RepID=A0A8H3R270_9GLOM|nr:hypothetical protein RCL_jg29211.t1 [Rhizophagus clarus]